MVKAFGYIRVSGRGQVNQDGPDRQKASITKFCADNGIELVDLYKDLAVSGTTGHEARDGFSRLILDALASGVTVVVVEKMDRLARDLIVSEFMIRELSSRSMKLYSVEAGFQDMVTSKEQDPGRTFIRQVFAAAAQLDKSSLVLKLRAARNRIRELEGKCEGGKAIEETPAGIRLLNLMTELRSTPMSWSSIAVFLNKSGNFKVNGKEWNTQEVASTYRRFAKRYKKKQLRKQNEHLLQLSARESQVGPGGTSSGGAQGSLRTSSGDVDERG